MLENLARLLLQCLNPTLIRILLIQLCDHHIIQTEIGRRLKTKRYGQLWRAYLTETDKAKQRGLAERLTLTTHVTVGDARRALKDFFPITKSKDRTPPRYKAPLDPARRDDDIATGLLALATLYDEHRDRVHPLSITEAASSGPHGGGQAVPGWDAAVSGLLAEEARTLQAEWLAVLDGTMESGPYKIFADYKADQERETAQKRNAVEYSLEALSAEPVTEAGNEPPPRPDRNRLRTFAEIRQERTARSTDLATHMTGIRPPKSPKDALADLEAPSEEAGTSVDFPTVLDYIKTHFPPAVQEALLLHYAEGTTQEEAAKRARTSVKTFTKAMEKLQKHFKLPAR
jgi:hypothetical protein